MLATDEPREDPRIEPGTLEARDIRHTSEVRLCGTRNPSACRQKAPTAVRPVHLATVDRFTSVADES